MIPEVGQFSLILALCLSMILATLPIIGAYQNNFLWMSMARPLSAGVFVFLGISIAILAYAFVTDDFSVQFVAASFESHVHMREETRGTRGAWCAGSRKSLAPGKEASVSAAA